MPASDSEPGGGLRPPSGPPPRDRVRGPSPRSNRPAAPAGDYQVRRAGPADHEGVVRELAAYFAFLGEDVDPDGLDHDVADWQGEYDGVAGVMLVVVDPAGEVVGTAAVRRLA